MFNSRVMTTAAILAAGLGTSAAQAEAYYEASIWGMYVVPTNVNYNHPNDCIDEDTDYCSNSNGFGLSFSAYNPLQNGNALIFDFLYEYHDETDDVNEIRVGDAKHGQLGFHYVWEQGSQPWGVFGFLAEGYSNEEDGEFETGEAYYPVVGLGLETIISGYAIQVGHARMIGTDTDDDDREGVESMTFARVSRSWDLWNGQLFAGIAGGFGDFEQSPTSKDDGTWLQFEAIYSAPLTVGSANASWFVGVTSDWMRVNDVDDTDVEKARLNAFKFGLNFPFGKAGTKAAPFSTPNFRAVFTNAAELD